MEQQNTKPSLKQLTAAFIADFYQRHGLPHGTIQSMEEEDRPSDKCCIAYMKPHCTTGTMAPFITLEHLTFQVWECATENKHLHAVRVTCNYEHTQKGRNGYTLRLSILTKPNYKGEAEYVGFVADDILSAYRHGIPKETAEREKGTVGGEPNSPAP